MREFLDAYAKAEQGDDEPLKTFWNTTLGQAWEGEIEKIEADELKRRAEIEAYRLPGQAENVVPLGCTLLLAGCDTQGNRVEVAVWGFGRGCEMWTVDHQIFHGNPAEDEVWNSVAEYLFERRFQHEGGQQMSIYATAIDSGGTIRMPYTTSPAAIRRGVCMRCADAPSVRRRSRMALARSTSTGAASA